MSFLSHAPPLGGLSPPHGAFQEYAAHTLEWSKVLSSKGSMGTCIPKGVTTFFHTASRRTERRLEAVRCKPLLGAGPGTGLRRGDPSHRPPPTTAPGRR